MSTDVRRGFSVLELAVATVAAMLVIAVLVPAISNAVGGGTTLVAISMRGRDIFNAVSGANIEREPLGLPPVWPAEGLRVTNAVHDIASMVFSNSTDYFNVLFDGKNLGTDHWAPFVAGLDYSKLAGGGVLAGTKRKYSAENNLWTVAMNVRDEAEDTIPVLITRNIDASSLASKVTERDWDKTLRFDPEWQTPYGNKAYILIRKGGAIFRARAKYVSYGTVYSKRTFDTTVDEKGQPVPHPLKYLTPTRTVVPGERAYAEGAVRAANPCRETVARQTWYAVKEVFRQGWVLAAWLGVAYVLAAVAAGVARYFTGRSCCLTGYGVGLGLFHYAIVVLWLSSLLGLFRGCFLWLLAVVVLAQASGIAFACVVKRTDHEARQRGIKWLVSAPLLACGVLFACGLLLVIVA